MGPQAELVFAVILVGLAAAGLVGSPPEQVRRISRQGGRFSLAPTVSVPTPLVRLGELIKARPEAPPARQRYVAGLVAAGVVPVLLRMFLPDLGSSVWLTAPPVAAAMIIFLGKVERPAARRRRERMIEELPHILELMAAAMSAGLPLRAAVREVAAVSDGPLAEDLAEVVKNVDLGRAESEAWRGLRTHPTLGRVSIDLARSVDSGTMVVATLRRYAQTARRDRRGVLEARAKTVGVKSVPPLMVCFVPAFFLVCVIPSVVTALQHAL
ncbi:type II secretion system F family protein [Microlunatus elymi]|uniref:Type II secretion system F family protein n=1 Tax=Microlunatus elymi TaxID=2596828 RepID=A0A516PVY7_9ACTN|nr:type II secretion system F family protein [Microlunatus elymi]QDP95121.1 type II secretion system F family protein [Microlunatus elymi]